MALLGVNIDHVATVREARKIDIPDPLEAARAAEDAGADSIVCHLREDRRHIQDKDLRRLKKAVKAKLNLEMSTSKEIVAIACRIKPDQATLVPEKREELTTEGGLDVASKKQKIRNTLQVLEKAGVRTSLFIDPDKRQIKASKEAGVRMIELHTGRYAEAKSKFGRKKEYEILKEASVFASQLGIKVFAGHGLNYENVKPLRRIKEIEEFNIGHSIIARSVFVGLAKAVREMKGLIK